MTMTMRCMKCMTSTFDYCYYPVIKIICLRYLSGLNVIDLYLFKYVLPKQLEASKLRINK